MKILFADKFPDSHLDQIKSLGHQADLSPDLTAEDLPGAIPDYEALVVRSTKVTKETLDAAGSLKLIVRAGAGTNTIDKQEAASKDIRVCNTPGKNAVAVAELAFGLLMSIDRNIPDNVIELRSGKWNKKKFAKAQGLCGQSVGIVGLGEIGLAFASRATAFGMSVFAIQKEGRSESMLKRSADAGIQFVDSMADLASTCDILTFHLPSNDQTKGMINSELLSQMKNGAVLLNTSRGEIVNDEDLIQAMDQKGIRAGLDVYNGEPGTGAADFSSALAQHPNVYGTHHIGASTNQAQNAVAEEVINVIEAFAKGAVLNCVNS